jgi:hypothetical protein
MTQQAMEMRTVPGMSAQRIFRNSTSELLQTGIPPHHQLLALRFGTTFRATQGQIEKSRISTIKLMQTRILARNQVVRAR